MRLVFGEPTATLYHVKRLGFSSVTSVDMVVSSMELYNNSMRRVYKDSATESWKYVSGGNEVHIYIRQRPHDQIVFTSRKTRGRMDY